LVGLKTSFYPGDATLIGGVDPMHMVVQTVGPLGGELVWQLAVGYCSTLHGWLFGSSMDGDGVVTRVANN